MASKKRLPKVRKTRRSKDQVEQVVERYAGAGVGGLVFIVALGFTIAGQLNQCGTSDPSPSPSNPSVLQQHAYSVVDEILGTLEVANIGFNVPQEMHLDEAETIEARISLSLSSDKLATLLTSKGVSPRTVETDRLKVSDVTEVRLEGGKAFDIVPITATRQGIGYQGSTDWRWQVTPRQHGEQTLHLIVDAVITLDGRDVPRTVRTYDRPIQIQITYWQRARLLGAENWRLVVGAVLVPLAGHGLRTAWRKWRRRRTSSNDTKTLTGQP